MTRSRFSHRTAVLFSLLACGLGTISCGFNALDTVEPQTQSAPEQHDENALVIENDSSLRDTSPGERYEIRLTARGGVPTLHWHVEKGALPPGIKLDDRGELSGAAERAGEFQFTASVSDSGSPRQSVQKEFVIRVRSALSLIWQSAAHVSGNRIDGSVEVTNTTADDIDLTFIAMAIAGNGRATAIGYQHFVLKKRTTKELPFGETLPHGGYVIHVDAVGEVATRNLIYREKLDTPGPLQVTVGP